MTLKELKRALINAGYTGTDVQIWGSKDNHVLLMQQPETNVEGNLALLKEQGVDVTYHGTYTPPGIWTGAPLLVFHIPSTEE